MAGLCAADGRAFAIYRYILIHTHIIHMRTINAMLFERCTTAVVLICRSPWPGEAWTLATGLHASQAVNRFTDIPTTYLPGIFGVSYPPFCPNFQNVVPLVLPPPPSTTWSTNCMLEAATVERCLLLTERCVLRTRLTAPGQLPGLRHQSPPSSIFIPWHRFGTLLWQAFEHGGARPNLVCL